MAEALRDVYAVFDRPAPLDVAYCQCHVCFKPGEVERILDTPYQALTWQGVGEIVHSAYNVWGTWPELAYFVPRLLELGCWDITLLGKLLQAAQKDPVRQQNRKQLIGVGAGMRDEEKRSLYRFYQVYLAEIVGISEGTSRNWRPLKGKWLVETVAFLAAFDEPLEPFMLSWRESFRPSTRAYYSLLLGELVLQEWSAKRVFTDTSWGEVTPLPKNEAFLVEQLRPARAAEYLTSAAEEITLLEAWDRQRVELAFGWMASLAA